MVVQRSKSWNSFDFKDFKDFKWEIESGEDNCPKNKTMDSIVLP